MGVPTLKLRFSRRRLSGGLMGMAGVPFPWHVTLIEPGSAFQPGLRREQPGLCL